MDIKSYQKINAETWDTWSEEGCEWTIPVSHQEYQKALNGEWGVYLTPCITVPKEWFPPLKDAQVLGLASGGGQQIPIFSALGAHCTVLDYSDKQLAAEKMVADREGYSVTILKGDMTDPLPFPDESFDLIFHPVSNCYVEKVEPIWKECYRVLKKGGVLLAGMDNGINFLFGDEHPLTVVYPLPFNPLKMEAAEVQKMVENKEGIQFSHTLEEQIGGQLRAGFCLTHLLEDRDRENGAQIRWYAPQYLMTRAVKLALAE